MKPCTIEDFGGDDVAAGYYYAWNGFTLLCPELVNKDGKTLTLNGAWGFNETSKIEFRVNRCQKEFHDCETEDNIDKFLRDMKIQAWMVHDHVDFREYVNRPTSKQMQIVEQLSAPIMMPGTQGRTVYEATALM